MPVWPTNKPAWQWARFMPTHTVHVFDMARLGWVGVRESRCGRRFREVDLGVTSPSADTVLLISPRGQLCEKCRFLHCTDILKG